MRSGNLQRLYKMQDYCEKGRCLRRTIRNYFGESAPDSCGSCSVCCGNRYGTAAPSGAKTAAPKSAKKAAASAGKRTARAAAMSEEERGDLFEELRAARMDLARQEHVAPFIICSDKTLESMCDLLPTSPDAMMSVNGMGSHKVTRYGATFIGVIREALGETGDIPDMTRGRYRTNQPWTAD